MDREEAIKRFENRLKGAIAVLDSGFGTHPGESDRLYRERKEMAQFALSALREQEDRRWIPVTERLPEEGGFVLAYNGTVEKAYLLDGEWSALGFYLQPMHDVSHWMPLPESPKEDAK